MEKLNHDLFDFFSFKGTRKVISMVKGLQVNGFIRELHGLSCAWCER